MREFDGGFVPFESFEGFHLNGPSIPGTASWLITDTGDGTGLIVTSPSPPTTPAWAIADNGDGTGTITSYPAE